MRLIDKIGKEITALPHEVDDPSVSYFEQKLIHSLSKADIMYSTILDELNGILYLKHEFHLSYSYQSIFKGYRKYLQLQVFYVFGYLKKLRKKIKKDLLKSGEKIFRIDKEDFQRLEDLLAKIPKEDQKRERDIISIKYCDVKFDDPAKEQAIKKEKDKKSKEFKDFLGNLLVNNVKDLPISGELNVLKFKNLYQMKRILTQQEYVLKEVLQDKKRIQQSLRKAYTNKLKIQKMRHSGAEHKLTSLLRDIQRNKEENQTYINKFRPTHLMKLEGPDLAEIIIKQVPKKIFCQRLGNKSVQTKPINLKNMQEQLADIMKKFEEKKKIIKIQRKNINEMREVDEKLKKRNTFLEEQNEKYKIILNQNGLLESGDEFQDMLRNLRWQAEKVKPLGRTINILKEDLKQYKLENTSLLLQIEKMKEEMKFKDKINQQKITQIEQIRVKTKVVTTIRKSILQSVKNRAKKKIKETEQKLKDVLDADDMIQSGAIKQQKTKKKEKKEKRQKSPKKKSKKELKNQKSIKKQTGSSMRRKQEDKEAEDDVQREIEKLKKEMQTKKLRSLKNDKRIEQEKELLDDDSDSESLISIQEKAPVVKRIFVNRAVQTQPYHEDFQRKSTRIKTKQKPQGSQKTLKTLKKKKITSKKSIIQYEENEFEMEDDSSSETEEVIVKKQPKKKKKKKKRIVMETPTESEESETTEEEIRYKKKKKRKNRSRTQHVSRERQQLDLPSGRKKSTRKKSQDLGKKKSKKVERSRSRSKSKSRRKLSSTKVISREVSKKSLRSKSTKKKNQTPKKLPVLHQQQKRSQKSKNKSIKIEIPDSPPLKKTLSRKKIIEVRPKDVPEPKQILVEDDDQPEISNEVTEENEDEKFDLKEQYQQDHTYIQKDSLQSKEIIQQWQSDEDIQQTTLPAMNIQNDSIDQTKILPREHKYSFNWREHITEQDKRECDQVINEIVKMPKNIRVFNDMLKIFQQFTGKQVDLESSLKIFPTFFQQNAQQSSQQTYYNVDNYHKNQQKMPQINRGYNSFQHSNNIQQMNRSMIHEKSWQHHQQQQSHDNIQQIRKYSKYKQYTQNQSQTRESFNSQRRIAQAGHMNPFNSKQKMLIQRKMLHQIIQKQAPDTTISSFLQTRQSMHNTKKTWDQEQEKPTCQHLKRFYKKKEEASRVTKKLYVLSTLLISKLPKRQKRIQVKLKKRWRFKKKFQEERQLHPKFTFEKVDLNYI